MDSSSYTMSVIYFQTLINQIVAISFKHSIGLYPFTNSHTYNINPRVETTVFIPTQVRAGKTWPDRKYYFCSLHQRPLLIELQKKGYLRSRWPDAGRRPQAPHTLTSSSTRSSSTHTNAPIIDTVVRPHGERVWMAAPSLRRSGAVVCLAGRQVYR